jgi:protein-tyrosine-phosphatase
MVAELSPEVVRRAEVHAALGDPGRLAIVDRLLVADRSPSGLIDELGMSSNLLAHHIGVLEHAGVLRRTRSEGDRRRSYLTLVPGVLDELAPATALAASRIVFVCTENAARSQLAAAIWAAGSAVPATSAGTHPAGRVHPGAVAAARRHRVRLPARRPRALDDVRTADDVVITVCDRAHERLASTLDHRHWSIPDPARPATDDAFDRAVVELTDRIARLTPTTRPA